MYPLPPDENPDKTEIPLNPPLDAHATEALMRMFLGALLFRLGGEEVFTEQELEDIMVQVGGVQILTNITNNTGVSEVRYILRLRDPQRALEIADRGISL